jgi:hypothetical protein
VETDCHRFVEGGRTRRGARLHQIAGDLGLTIDSDGLADQLAEIDAVSPAAEADLDALMDETLAVQSRSDTGAFQKTDRSLFDQPRSDAAQHIFAATLLDDHVVNSVLLQKLPK